MVRPAPATAEHRRKLEDERSFLLRSIEDLETERAAGDISDADYEALRDGYTARAAVVLRALEDTDGAARAPSPSFDRRGGAGRAPLPAASDPAAAGPGRRRRRGRRVLLWAGLAAFAAATVVLVVAEVSARLPGQTATGSLTLSRAQRLERTLAQAEDLESRGRLAQALVLYHQVLTEDPTQEQALAESGWLEYEAGVSAKNASLLGRGQEDEQAAERADPGAYAPHLYLGSMLLAEGRASAAADEFARLLSSHPPVSVEQAAWPYLVRAFTQAGRPLPPVPAGVEG
jgi:tetratricopeptide (TPR) repeat protein